MLITKRAKWAFYLMVSALTLFGTVHYFFLLGEEGPTESSYSGSSSWMQQTARPVSLTVLPYSMEDFLIRKEGPNLAKLPDLTKLTFNQYELRPENTSVKFAPMRSLKFQVPMSRAEKDQIDRLLELFLNMLYVNRLGDCVVMIAGTLLGSFRHHEAIPWDDDIDLGMNVSCVKSVLKIINESNKTKILPENVQWKHFHGSKLKMYFSDIGKRTSEYPWNWPYLDVLFFQSNSTHIHEIPKSYERYFEYPLDEIYPILYRPFGKFWIPAPSHLMAHFKYDFTDDPAICTVYGYSHITESMQKRESAKCSSFQKTYAFVRRELPALQWIDQGEFWRKQNIVWINESLVIVESIANSLATRDRLLHSLILPGHVSTLLSTDPYSFRAKL